MLVEKGLRKKTAHLQSGKLAKTDLFSAIWNATPSEVSWDENTLIISANWFQFEVLGEIYVYLEPFESIINIEISVGQEIHLSLSELTV